MQRPAVRVGESRRQPGAPYEAGGMLPLPSALAGMAHVLPIGLGYVLCSSLMMIVNKWALKVFPFPGTLMTLQFFSSAVAVRLLSLCGQLECEPLVWTKARSFLLVPLFFDLTIYTNIKLLQSSTVETAIVFRTVVPIFTSAADWIWMGRALPEARSACGLGVVVIFAIVYAAISRDGIHVEAWLWAWAYVLTLSIEMVYVKHVLGSVPMTTWTRVYYNNALAMSFAPVYMSVGHEYTRLGEAVGTLLNAPQAALAVGMSCAIGLGISFTGFGFRNLVTATTFTVVGVMNKLLTVVASLMLLSHGATSPWSVMALICCIGGAETLMQPPSKGTKAARGTMYRQAPMRAVPEKPPETAGLLDDEKDEMARRSVSRSDGP